ncbi:MAG: TerB family tellurite resistance protein, partial [Rhizobiales bacterium]|nr:TerB family tellurite resistance protein [Hyphomicrobiales bacterium]
DGEVHEFEENVLWRVAELMGVSSQVRIRLKQSARATAAGQ